MFTKAKKTKKFKLVPRNCAVSYLTSNDTDYHRSQKNIFHLF